ncbi:MAG: choice-of-anchor A family protein [Phycisphaerales bacterium]
MPAAAFAGTDVLIVGGNAQPTNINMAAGNFRVGGSIAGNVNHNGGGAPPSTTLSAVVRFDPAPRWSARPHSWPPSTPDSNASIPMGQPAQAVFNAAPGGDGVAVFSITASSLFQNNLVQSIDINFNGASSVIINVSGASTTWTDGNFVGNFTSPRFARTCSGTSTRRAASTSADGRSGQRCSPPTPTSRSRASSRAPPGSAP